MLLTIPSKKRRKSGAGSAGLEFAIGTLLLIPVFTSTFQYGYIFYEYNVLQDAVANGAHYGALRNYTQQCSTLDSTFQTAVQNMVVYGDPTVSSGTPVVPNLTTSYVTVTMSPAQTTCPTVTWTPSTITVAIQSYTSSGTTNTFKIDGIFGSLSLNGKPSVTYTYQGIFSPP